MFLTHRRSLEGFVLGFVLLLAGLMCLAQAQITTTGAGNKAWSPARLAGLVAWYDATSGVYVDAGATLATNGQTVQQWNDKSGNGYHLLQATAGSRPTYQTAGFNSRETVLFAVANSKWMATAADTVAMGTGNVGSVFGVGRSNGGAGGARIVSYFGNGQGDDITTTGSAAWILVTQTNGTMQSYRVGFYANDAAFFSNATDYRFGNIYDNTNNTNYVNNVAGTPVAAVGVAWTSPGAISLSNFSRGSPSAFWDGPLSEIIITNTAISAADRLFLDNYFKAVKWGL